MIPYLASIDDMVGKMIELIIAGTKPCPGEEGLPDSLTSVEVEMRIMHQEVDTACPKASDDYIRRHQDLSLTLERRVAMLSHIRR